MSNEDRAGKVKELVTGVLVIDYMEQNLYNWSPTVMFSLMVNIVMPLQNEMHNVALLYMSVLINVYCRCRPLSPEFKSHSSSPCLFYTDRLTDVRSSVWLLRLLSKLPRCVRAALKAPPLRYHLDIPAQVNMRGIHAWSPPSLDRDDRRGQQHSEEDYALSFLWQVQSHLLGWGKP